MDAGSGRFVHEWGVVATCGFLFIAAAAATAYMCTSMSGGMAMPGGWIMSMIWMRMPHQSWSGAVLMFLGMWAVMMVAMMLPSVAPALLRCRFSLRGEGNAYSGALTALVGAGYFFVWAALGGAIYPIGVMLSAAAMRSAELSRLVPFAASVAALIAGLVQLSSWKALQLRRCRHAAVCGRTPTGARDAWRCGILLGADCMRCCWSYTAMLLAAGVMNLGAMALVAAAIAVERIAPRPEFTARASGLLMIATAILMIGSAMGT